MDAQNFVVRYTPRSIHDRVYSTCKCENKFSGVPCLGHLLTAVFVLMVMRCTCSLVASVATPEQRVSRGMVPHMYDCPFVSVGILQVLSGCPAGRTIAPLRKLFQDEDGQYTKQQGGDEGGDRHNLSGIPHRDTHAHRRGNVDAVLPPQHVGQIPAVVKVVILVFGRM